MNTSIFEEKPKEIHYAKQEFSQFLLPLANEQDFRTHQLKIITETLHPNGATVFNVERL